MQNKSVEKDRLFSLPPPDLPIPISLDEWRLTSEEIKANLWSLWIELRSQNLPFKSLHEILEDFRLTHDFTQKELCEITGISKNTIPQYLYGEKFPPGDGMAKIIKAMYQMGIPQVKCMEYLLAFFKHHLNQIVNHRQ